jgi:hypothetical protein
MLVSSKGDEAMNKLSIEKRAQLIALLVEGNSLRATSHISGVAFNTVLKFVEDVGKSAAIYQDKTLRNLKCRRSAPSPSTAHPPVLQMTFPHRPAPVHAEGAAGAPAAVPPHPAEEPTA